MCEKNISDREEEELWEHFDKKDRGFITYEDFAKAVDDLLKEIHDIDEAQRRLRIIAEGTLPKPDNNRKP